MAQMFDDIMANMDKELGQQRMKVNHLGQQRQVIGRRLENLEQNLAENKVVWLELSKYHVIDERFLQWPLWTRVLFLIRHWNHHFYAWNLITQEKMLFLVQTEKDGADPQCYKSGAGILVPQKLSQIKELVDKRGNAMQQEMEQ